MQFCIYCNSNYEKGILLSNGSIIHDKCYKELLEQKDLLLNNCNSKHDEIIKIQKKLKSLPLKVLGFFINSKTIASLETKVKSEEKNLKLLQNDFLKLSNLLTQLYDYWIDYPPDWNGRRDEIIKGKGYCQKCYRGIESGISLHIHHRIPISQGGTHKKENLICLCEDCHQSKHRQAFTYSFNEHKDNPFIRKLYILREAIEKGYVVSFNYRKYEGDKSSRSVLPEEFKEVGSSQCIRGYCYLRKDYRTFAIRRMTNLRLINHSSKISS